MICSLLKAFKVYFISTALFHSSTTVHTTPSAKDPVAISYRLEYPQHHINNIVTVIKDYRFRHCFFNGDPHAYSLVAPHLSVRVKTWSSNAPNATPIPIKPAPAQRVEIREGSTTKRITPTQSNAKRPSVVQRVSPIGSPISPVLPHHDHHVRKHRRHPPKLESDSSDSD